MRYDLSVIIPFFNSSRFIHSSIKNAIDITKNLNAQIIYVDDKSKDDSYRKLKKKANNKNDILILRSKKNLGPGNARNIGLKKAQGKKIIFLDIEDRLVVSNLKKMLEIYRKNSLNLINYNHIELNKNIKKKVFPPHLISSSNRKNMINSNFGKVLMLAIAYSASIGGFATLYGTPPNLILKSNVEQFFNYTIDFDLWFKMALPLSISLLFI